MRVLLVEDDQKFSRNLKKALEIEGYVVDTAFDGARGLALGLRTLYDLIIMDVMLPKQDGMSVVSELRQREIQAPVIMLTARGELEDRVAGLDSGADDYLVKPFGFEELFARLRSLLRRKKTIENLTLTMDTLMINPGARAVLRAGTPIALTPKEYRLLLYLMRNRTRIVPRSELTSLLWKKRPAGNLLDVHIRYLRRKIDDAFPRKLIHTVKGVGYQLSEGR